MSWSCSPPIYEELFSRKYPYSLRKHGEYYKFSIMLFNKIYKKKTTHFYHPNLEINVYKTIARVIYIKIIVKD